VFEKTKSGERCVSLRYVVTFENGTGLKNEKIFKRLKTTI